MSYVNKQNFSNMSGYPHFNLNTGGGSGTVTSVATDTSLAGGPIITSGTLGIAAPILTTINNTVENVNVLEQKTSTLNVGAGTTTISGDLVVTGTTSGAASSGLYLLTQNGPVITNTAAESSFFSNVTSFLGSMEIPLSPPGGPAGAYRFSLSGVYTEGTAFGTVVTIRLTWFGTSFALASFPISVGDFTPDFSITFDIIVRPSADVDIYLFLVQFSCDAGGFQSNTNQRIIGSHTFPLAGFQDTLTLPLDVTVQYPTAINHGSIMVRHAVITRTF